MLEGASIRAHKEVTSAQSAIPDFATGIPEIPCRILEVRLKVT